MGGEHRLNIPKLTSLAVFINLYLYGQHRGGGGVAEGIR